MKLPGLMTMFPAMRYAEDNYLAEVKAEIEKRIANINIEYDAILVMEGRSCASMIGVIFNDKKKRFADGAPVITSRIIRQTPVGTAMVLLETRNSKYLLMH